ncbi:hypothetical protein [Priestia megaterium]|uniref:hypothetical protein n=1 Tax=Priestia megaterium TaxID=1404 RepID=UPI001C462AB1|nr:hypothetical protein [Priestia megaterium]MBV6734527.1 hypothetical protein [Priestia megaterium]
MGDHVIDIREIEGDFYELAEAVKVLTAHRAVVTKPRRYKENILNLAKEAQFKVIVFQEQYYFYKQDIDVFLEEHISYCKATEMLKTSDSSFYYLIKSHNIKKYQLSHKHKFYARKELIPLIEQVNQRVLIDSKKNNEKNLRFNTEGYYPTPEAQKKLNLYSKQWDKLREEFNLKEVRFGGRSFYSKKEINGLFKKQSEDKDKYYCLEDLEKLLNLNKETITKRFKGFKKTVPSYLRNRFPRSFCLFVKSEVEQMINEHLQNEVFATLTDPLDMFNYKYNLHFRDVEFNYNSNTVNLWLEFAKNNLINARGSSPKYISNKVNDYIQCTKHVYKFTSTKEIYEFTSNEINLNLLHTSIPRLQRLHMHKFICKIYDFYLSNYNKKIFKLERIIRPKKLSTEVLKKEIYSFDEYKTLFDFCNQTTFHKIKAIEDIKSLFLDKEYFNYDSSWLYNIIHLNNAWRHSDVVKFPRIEFEGTKIEGLEWLENHDINFEDAQKIVRQVMRKDLKVSKTNATNNFFCSQDLCISFATAAVICELRTRKVAPLSDFIIDFGVRNNNFSQKSKTLFYKDVPIKFKFQSLKMNRSLLSYTYSLLVQKGKYNAALEVAQRLRAHYNYETTNIYIVIPDEELDYLTKQLFSREHFGFIPNLLAEVLFGESNVNEKKQRTLEIIKLKEIFGGVYGIEHLAAFLNKVQRERKTVAEIILDSSFEEVQELLFNIYANLLPSKQENYQCLYGRCVRPNLKCSDNCSFAIPNFYAIASLAKDVEERVDAFIDSFYKTTLEAEKIKMVNRLLTILNCWGEAITKFGKEEVYKFLNRDELKEKLQLINVEEISSYIAHPLGGPR